MPDNIELFEDKEIRTAWDNDKEEWYFSIVDVISVLTDQSDYDHAKNYWKVLKHRLIKEGNELVTSCNQLKLKSPKDGKKYKTDVADTEQLLRIIQSVPSKKAEPFKMWLAQVGRERIEETIDPELAINRAVETYQKKGYPDDWIHQRLLAIRIRNELTDEWQKRGVEKGREYSVLMQHSLNLLILGMNLTQRLIKARKQFISLSRQSILLKTVSREHHTTSKMYLMFLKLMQSQSRRRNLKAIQGCLQWL